MTYHCWLTCCWIFCIFFTECWKFTNFNCKKLLQMSFIIIISLLRFFFIIITTIYYYLLIIAIPWLCFIFLLNTMRYTAKKSDTRNVFMLYRLYQQQCCQLGLKIWDKKLPKFDLQKSSQSWKHWSVVASFFDQPFPSSVCHFLAFDQKVPDWLYDISSIFNHTISICSFDLNYHPQTTNSIIFFDLKMAKPKFSRLLEFCRA